MKQSSKSLYLATVPVLVFVILGHNASADTYKQLPPAGMKIEPSVRKSLQQRIDDLRQRTDSAMDRSIDADTWRADVEVLLRAVRLALQQNLFFKKRDIKDAHDLLDEADRRLKAATAGARGLRLMGLPSRKAAAPKLLVGGFVSHIDDSVQPYGLVIPTGFDPNRKSPYRMDVWLHGRGDTKTELQFLTERMNNIGHYHPAETVVLHPFGRHCNAFKFAGERDVYEAMDHVGRLISVDEGRVAIRGFSMGGAACWHFAVHDPGRWFAANPGAGFVDTLVYQNWGNDPPFPLTDTRRQLLRWYDVLPWVTNLKNVRTVAYSGEVDKQKQAADRVYEASQRAGFDWPYVIGKGMAHKLDPESIERTDEIIADWALEERPKPRSEIEFVTYTLRYHSIDWLSVTGLVRHWSPGRVRAKIAGSNHLQVQTDGVTALDLDFKRSRWPSNDDPVRIDIDGQSLTVPDVDDAPGWQGRLAREKGWHPRGDDDETLRKRPGMQGPIDDAFTDRFIFVIPSRPAKHGVVQRWIDREQKYAQDRWRRLMRGDVHVVQDTDLTDHQIATSHLICFGDFTSNRYLAEIAPRLPFSWTKEAIRVGDRAFDPGTHALALCYPNPRNPNRYVVVNSGMTFREFSNNSNSRQIAMLPDWAVMDVSAEQDAIFAGRIVADGFFDECWQLASSPRQR